MHGSFLGQEYTDNEIKENLDSLGAKYKKYEDKELYETIAKSISEGSAIGWFAEWSLDQGLLETGLLLQIQD